MQSISCDQLKKWGAQHLQGPGQRVAYRLATPETSGLAGSDTLIFLKPGVSFSAWDTVAILILDPALPASSLPIPANIDVFVALDFRQLMGLALGVFDQKISAFPNDPTQAAIAPSAQIGVGVRIAPRATIGEGAVIGEQAWIGSGAVIEPYAHIGAHSRIHANVVIGHHCSVGLRCEVHSNTTMGSDGFGYIPQKDRAPIKIPQVGRVVLGDDVEIGANCAIDRGAIADTVIGSGTKIDNLCHIAHNCKIGENCLITAGFFVAGSSTIGDRFTCGGNVAVADHVTITNDVMLGGRTAVTKDLLTPGAYTGFPVEPMKDGLKTLASLRELTQLRKTVQTILKHLNLQA